MRVPNLYIIIPCYNEHEVLPITSKQFLDKLKQLIQADKILENSRILLVDDGSRDNTWEIICGLAAGDEHFAGIRQSRNYGHQNAVLAGLMEAKDRCDITISIDCDGQDDINAMDQMIELYQKGNEVVYGVRDNRDSDTFFKRFTAENFYKMMKWMGVESVFNHADYRLLSSKVLQSFSEFQEVNLFLRGMIPLVGWISECGCVLCAERTDCRRKPLSAPKNAGACYRRHHQFICQADSADYRGGNICGHHRFPGNSLVNL